MQCLQRQLSLWCRAYAVNGRHSCLAVRTTSRSALAPSRAVPEAQVSVEPNHFSDERSSSNDSTSTSAPTMTPAQVKRKGPKQRYRLDEYCLLQYPQFSRNVIQSWILQGKVFVDEKPVLKSGHQVTEGVHVTINAEEPKYVCRAGFKLEKALAHFSIDVRGLTALDSGQSTGGFTDCMLQNGAAKVIGIDVGHGQVSGKIRADPRVVVMEKFNLRNLKMADLAGHGPVDLATLDLSFISVLKVIPAVVSVLTPGAGQLLVLIKPQFEAGRDQVQYGGIVRDPAVHQEVISRVTAGIEAWGFDCKGVTESPIKGDKSGNTEFLAHFVRNPSKPVTAHLYGASAAGDEEDRMLPGSLQGQVTSPNGDAANMDSDGRGSSNLSGGSVSSGSGSGVRRVKSTGSSKRGRTR